MAIRNNAFVKGDPEDGAFLAVDANRIKSETDNYIAISGQTLSEDDTAQMAKASAVIASKGDFYKESETSASDTYILEPDDEMRGIWRLKDGMRIRFKVVNTNTGASTVNINGLGVKAIETETGVLSGGEIVAGKTVNLEYSETVDKFLISVSDLGGSILGADSKTTPINEDLVALVDTEDGNSLKKATVGSLKTAITSSLEVADESLKIVSDDTVHKATLSFKGSSNVLVDLDYLSKLSFWTEVFDSPETLIYSLTSHSDGYIYAGTGSGGMIYRNNDGTTWTLVFDSPEAYIYSLTSHSDGYIYAGTGNGGMIYRNNSTGGLI